ncbi:MAG: metallophosphoesterase [Candidatus Heimdallarchaeota archaeon]|nr:metallophosphoesterase [Candidatus Heimdallarchaeota archaeon]MCK4877522.1 metallophosphoesterase [Candidatus Heimdallarchaeota archaeon]
MKILATADSHFGYEFGRTSQAKNQSIQKMFDVYQEVMQQAKSERVDLVLHGGDMFNRSQPKKKIISEAYNLIRNIAEEGIPFIGIPGNHDRSKLPETLLNFIDKDIHLLSKFSAIEVEDLVILGFPFIGKNPRVILSKANSLAESYPQKSFLILCHQLFDGAMFGPHQHVFKNRSDTLVTTDLPENVRLILSGHIHRAQSLQNRRVYYTGSLERTSFMEIIEPKGYLLFNLEDDYFDVRFKEIETLPMEVKELDITDVNQISKLIDQHYPDNSIRTQLRFFGRKLTEDEIKFLWAYLPAKEFPLLSFSPKNPSYILRSLYSNRIMNFHFEAS